jgi:deaminated glutathione amidase
LVWNWTYCWGATPVNVGTGYEADAGCLLATIGVAALQLDLEKTNNLARLGEEVAAAKKRLPWVDLIVLPELATYGVDVRHAEPAAGPAEREFCRLARELKIWLIGGSLFQTEGEHTYNVAPVIDPSGQVVTRYRKMFPFCPYEAGVAPGGSFCLFELPGVARFGVTICYDIWFPETIRSLVWLGADVILCPTLTNTIDRDVELALVRAHAASNQCYFVNVNSAGRLAFGRSIVCGPGGEVIHEAGQGREIIAFELDTSYLARVRERGWNGLGQNLKAFRDARVAFPPYEPGARSAALDALGPLVKPRSML